MCERLKERRFRDPVSISLCIGEWQKRRRLLVSEPPGAGAVVGGNKKREEFECVFLLFLGPKHPSEARVCVAREEGDVLGVASYFAWLGNPGGAAL